MKNKIPKEIKRRKGKSFAIINKIRENEFYKMGFKAGQKQTKDAFKEMIESCDEEPCCHGIQKNELLSKIGEEKQDD